MLKKILTIAFFFLSVSLYSQTQVVIFCNTGDKFWVISNGEKVSNLSSEKITFTTNPVISKQSIRIIFSRPEIPVVDTIIYTDKTIKALWLELVKEENGYLIKPFYTEETTFNLNGTWVSKLNNDSIFIRYKIVLSDSVIYLNELDEFNKIVNTSLLDIEQDTTEKTMLIYGYLNIAQNNWADRGIINQLFYEQLYPSSYYLDENGNNCAEKDILDSELLYYLSIEISFADLAHCNKLKFTLSPCCSGASYGPEGYDLTDESIVCPWVSVGDDEDFNANIRYILYKIN